MRRLRVVGLAVWAAAALGLLSSVAASAAPLPTTVVETSPMTVVGFDAAVASQNGYQTAIPENTVGGNCGTSDVFLTGFVGHYTMATGFTIVPTLPGAVDYSWNVLVTGPANYHKNWGYGGVLRDRHSWNAAASANVRAGGYTANVDPLTSYAILANGLVCHSAAPHATATVG